jgi:hypothetical protein
MAKIKNHNKNRVITLQIIELKKKTKSLIEAPVKIVEASEKKNIDTLAFDTCLSVAHLVLPVCSLALIICFNCKFV